MVLAAAKAFSASSVAITDIRPDNLPVAKQLGAKHALDQSQATSASDTVEALKAVFAEGPDIVIDCVGFESTITVSSRFGSLFLTHCSDWCLPFSLWYMQWLDSQDCCGNVFVNCSLCFNIPRILSILNIAYLYVSWLVCIWGTEFGLLLGFHASLGCSPFSIQQHPEAMQKVQHLDSSIIPVRAPL